MQHIIDRAAIFLGVEANAVAEMTDRLEVVDAGAGEVFFTQGEPGTESYIIISGKVKTGCRAPTGERASSPSSGRRTCLVNCRPSIRGHARSPLPR